MFISTSPEFREHHYDNFFELYVAGLLSLFFFFLILLCGVWSCLFVCNIFYCLISLSKSVCFFVLVRSATSDSIERMVLWRRPLWGQTVTTARFSRSVPFLCVGCVYPSVVSMPWLLWVHCSIELHAGRLLVRPVCNCWWHLDVWACPQHDCLWVQLWLLPACWWDGLTILSAWLQGLSVTTIGTLVCESHVQLDWQQGSSMIAVDIVIWSVGLCFGWLLGLASTFANALVCRGWLPPHEAPLWRVTWGHRRHFPVLGVDHHLGWAPDYMGSHIGCWGMEHLLGRAPGPAKTPDSCWGQDKMTPWMCCGLSGITYEVLKDREPSWRGSMAPWVRGYGHHLGRALWATSVYLGVGATLVVLWDHPLGIGWWSAFLKWLWCTLACMGSFG